MSETIEPPEPSVGVDRRTNGVQSVEPILVPLLSSISKSTRLLVGIALRDAGVVAGQDELLLALGDGRRITARDLAETLNIRPSTVSKMVDRLARKGLVSKSVNVSDARLVMITLTDAGIAVRDRVAAAHADVVSALTRALGDDTAFVVRELRQLDGVLATRLRRWR